MTIIDPHVGTRTVNSTITVQLNFSEYLSVLWLKPPAAHSWRRESPISTVLTLNSTGQGQQYVLLKGVDLAGNLQQPVGNFSWFVALQCLVAPLGQSPINELFVTPNRTLNFNLTASIYVSSLMLSVDGLEGKVISVPPHRSVVYVANITSALPDGNHRLQVWGADLAGVLDRGTCASFSWIVDTIRPVSDK